MGARWRCTGPTFRPWLSHPPGQVCTTKSAMSWAARGTCRTQRPAPRYSPTSSRSMLRRRRRLRQESPARSEPTTPAKDCAACVRLWRHLALQDFGFKAEYIPEAVQIILPTIPESNPRRPTPENLTALLGHLFADEEGRYGFWGLTPTPYPIPHDGPVGKMLEATGRSPMRASHLHFMVTAPGLRTLVTHIFVAGDELLKYDTVFGVKQSLIKDFVEQPADTPTPDGRNLGRQGWARTRFDIVLAPEVLQ